MKQSIGPSSRHSTLGNARLPAARITAAMLGLLMCVMFGMVAGCSSKDKDGKGGAGDKDQTKEKAGSDTGGKKGSEANVPLTEDFFPMTIMMPGKSRKFVSRQYDLKSKDGEYKEARSFVILVKDNGIGFTNGGNKSDPDILSLGFTDFVVDGKGKEKLTKSSISPSLGAYRKMERGIENLVRIAPNEWRVFIKYGAKPGDKWGDGSAEKPPQLLKCEYVRCELHDGVPCAVISVISAQQNTDFKFKHQWSLLKGVGVARVDIYMYRAGKNDFKGSWIPTRQHISDDWKGDKSPLVVENPTK